MGTGDVEHSDPGSRPRAELEALLDRGAHAFEERDFERALVLARDVFQHAQEADLRFDAAIDAEVALRRLNRHEEALELIEEEIRLRPDYAESWISKSLVLAKLDRLDEALAVNDDALARFQDHPDLLWCRAGLLRLGGAGQGEVLDVARKATKAGPKSDRAWASAAYAYRINGRYQDALDAIDRAIELAPDAETSWIEKAQVLVALQRETDALVAIDAAVELSPHFATAHDIRAAILDRLGRPDEAIEALRRAIAAAPHEPSYRVRLGFVLLDQARHDEALLAFSQARVRDPESDQNWVYEGTALGLLEQHEPALAAFRNALQLNDRSVSARLGEAAELGNLGQVDEAIASYRQVLELSPRETRAWAGLGRAYRSSGRYDAATQAFRRGFEIDSTDASLAVGVGACLIAQDRLVEALEFFDLARERGTTSGLMELNRGVALSRLGREYEARRAWERAANADPPIEVARDFVNAASARGAGGAWFDYWFGPLSTWPRRVSGLVALAGLVFTLTVSFVPADKWSAIRTGTGWEETILPTLVLLLLLVLPSLSRVAVGGVEVEPLPASGADRTVPSLQDIPPVLDIKDVPPW